LRSSGIFIFATLAVIVGMSFGANYGQLRTIDHVVGVDAERKAMDWASFAAKKIPEIGALLKTGTPTPQQEMWISEVAHYGDVFRFKLFDRFGRNFLVSDNLSRASPPHTIEDHSAIALRVMKSGETLVALSDGRAKPDRPDLYAEAYVPVRDADGQIIGVAEAYLDQTAMWRVSRESFFKLSMVLTIVFTLALLILYAAFLLKGKQEGMTRKQVDFLAKHDPLSSLHNRGGFNEQLEQMKREGKVSSAQTAVIYLDIDHFKRINDTFGHKAGDAFLSHVGESISSCLGPDDIAGRMGGDEFIMIVQQPDLESTCVLAEKLQGLVSKPLWIDGTPVSGTLSIGIQFCGGEHCLVEENIHRADLALYQAKMDGRNVYRVFTPDLEAKVARRRKVEAVVLTGMKQNLFAVHFQPLLNQKTKRCVGFEALLRLTDVEGETIHPSEFVPIAESVGAIEQIGAWVLKQAAQAAAEWPESLFVSVNLSARQFDGGGLVDLVKHVIAETGLRPERLELEVTESLLMDDSEKVGNQLNDLRALGISIAMDDFGTGYSSLGYLWQFGFDKLKIDRSFILGLEKNDGRAKEILDTIIVLGHRLNMIVTAEGIETEAQAKILSDLDCDQFQGYLYGKAMPGSEVAAYMLKNISAGNEGMGKSESKKRAAH
jgi:diguanylate cyclase (GGDEF)-like protein